METKSFKTILWKRWDILVATLTFNGLILAGCLGVVDLYDQILPNKSDPNLYIMTAIAGGVLLLGLILAYARSNIFTWLKMQYTRQISSQVYARTVQLGDTNEHLPKVHYLKTIDHNREIRFFLNSPEFLSFLNLPFIFGFLAIIYIISPICTMPSGIGIVLLGGICGIQSKKTKLVLELHQKLIHAQSDLLIQISRNYHTLKTMGMESLILRRFEKLQYQKASLEDTLIYKDDVARDISTLIYYAAIIAVLFVGAREVFSETMSLGTMVACMLLTGIILSPLRSIASNWLRNTQFNRANNTMRSYLKGSNIGEDQSLREHEFTGMMQLEDIEFQYKSNEPVLRNLNLSVQPNTIVTIFGANGVGKTTLAQLISNKLSLQAGKISFDGYNLHEISPKSFTQQVLYVSAIMPLFKGTIMDNLTLFRVGPLVEEAVKLSQDLGLSHWVEAQPLAYQTPISDDDSFTLPAGIKQRIGLIRAILNEPKILILDEVNAAIDEEGDVQLKKILTDLKEVTTIILITHRPSMKQIADESYDLVNGALVPSMDVDVNRSRPIHVSRRRG